MEIEVNDFINFTIILISTYFCAIVFYIRSRSLALNRITNIILILLNIFLPILCQLFGGNRNIIAKIIFIVLICVSLIMIDRRDLYSSIPISIISISVSYCLEYLSILLSATVLYFLNYTETNFLSTILSCFFQIVICIVLSNNKRIKRGFNSFNNNNFGIGLLITSYIFMFSLLLTQQINTEIGIILLFICPLALTGLILWIRSIVKRYYKNKLQDRMDEYTQKEMEDKDRRIERLEVEVTVLAKQVHRDNHLMTSVDRSVQELAECDSAEQREQIVGEIHTLYLERNDSIAKEQQKNKILPSTGFALIDSSLSELYVKAAARGISFDLTVSEEPYYLVNNIISQTDLQTLLCDHIKDAIIAVESAGITDGRILVTIEKKDSIFEIAIRDNGVDFEADTLARIGKEQVTTHADDGGSGIGFMTTFETLHKTKGSLIITEYEQKTPFSKSVAFVFDGVNRFVISTYRKEELEKSIDRDDVLIIR